MVHGAEPHEGNNAVEVACQIRLRMWKVTPPEEGHKYYIQDGGPLVPVLSGETFCAK